MHIYNICTYAHMHIYTYANIHRCTYAHRHIYAYAHIHTCHKCTCAQMHECTYAQRLGLGISELNVHSPAGGLHSGGLPCGDNTLGAYYVSGCGTPKSGPTHSLGADNGGLQCLGLRISRSGLARPRGLQCGGLLCGAYNLGA